MTSAEGPVRTIFSWCVAAALALSGGLCWGNDGEFYGEGADLYPIQNEVIALESEELLIEQLGPALGSYVGAWRVTVVYRFRNRAKLPQRVQMGFPEHCQVWVEEAEEKVQGECKRPAIKDFVALVDGKKAKVKVKRATAPGALPEAQFDRVHTFEVAFEGEQEREVKHVYTHAGGITSPWHSEMHYILRTGALWAGPMGRVTIEVRALDSFQEVVIGEGMPSPAEVKPYGKLGKAWIWRLQDFEPTADLHMTLSEPLAVTRSEALSALRQRFEEEGASLDAAALEELRNTIFALYGAPFERPEVRAKFAPLPWYAPMPGYQPSWISASDWKLIRAIKAQEAARKAPR